MKGRLRVAALLMVSAVLAGCQSFSGDSVPEKVGNGIRHGGEAAGRGIEKGAEATAGGLNTAGEWVDRKLHKDGKNSEKAADK